MENAPILEKYSDTTKPQEVFALQPNKQKYSTVMVICGLLLLIAVGVGGYYLGIVAKPQEASRPIVVVPTPPPSTTTEVQNSSTPTPQASADWKHMSLSLVSQSAGGVRNYTYSFNYPVEWEIKELSRDHGNDDLINGCHDFLIVSENTNVEIKLFCSMYSGKDIMIPKQFVMVYDLGATGNDDSRNYIVRYLDTASQVYRYAYLFVQPGEDMNTKTDASPEILVTYVPDDSYFIPTSVSVTTTDEKELTMVDQVVKVSH